MRTVLMTAMTIGLMITAVPVVQADVAVAGGYTLVAEASGWGRTVRLWKNNDNTCIHAEGVNLLTDDVLWLDRSSSNEDDQVRARFDGATISTPSRCTHSGGAGNVHYWGKIDLRASTDWVITGRHNQ